MLHKVHAVADWSTRLQTTAWCTCTCVQSLSYVPRSAGPFGRATSPGSDLPDSARSSLSIENRNMATALLLDRRIEQGYTASMSIQYILTMAPSPTGSCHSVISHHTSTRDYRDVSVSKCERHVRVNRRLREPNDAKKRGLPLVKPDVGGSTDTVVAGMESYCVNFWL